MGDAAYERAATADEIERMCALVREAIAAGAAGFSTSFSFAHRGVDGKPVPSRFADARRGRGAVPRRGRGGQGRGADHAGRAVHLRRCVRVAAARRPAVHLPAVRGAGRQAPRAGRGCTRQGIAQRRARVAAGHAAAAHDAVHDGRRVQPQHRPGVRRADEGEPRGAARGVPRSRVAGARGRRPGGVADEAALGDVRGLRVAAVPRAAGPAGERPRARARLQPARRDVRDRGRRGSHDALSRVHRQRRRRRRRPPAHARPASRSASPTRARTSTSCATRRCPPTCSARGCASAASCRSRPRCAS